MIFIPKTLKEKRKIKITKDQLINFENEIKETYNKGQIRGPIHLSSGNEEFLIKIFSLISKNDWVLSSWRNHYHALLHGVSSSNLKKFILDGKSMSVASKKPRFISSSIVGGTIPIALGLALAIKKKNENKKVWCFIGDMTAETGLFHEAYKYAKSFRLNLNFVIEDNGLSTNTPTHITWNKKKFFNYKNFPGVIYYRYKNQYPHHGTGKWVIF